MAQNIYKVTQEVYKALKNGQIVELNGQEYTYDPTALYTIVDATEPDYRLYVEENEVVLRNNGYMIDSITPNFAKYAALAERDNQGNTIYDSYIRWENSESQDFVYLPNINTDAGSIESTNQDYDSGLVIRTNGRMAIWDENDQPIIQFLGTEYGSQDQNEIRLFDTYNVIYRDLNNDCVVLKIDDSSYLQIESANGENPAIMEFVSDESMVDNDWAWSQNAPAYFNSDVLFDNAQFDGTVNFTGYVNGDLIPTEDKIYNIGTSTARYQNTHSQYIFTDYLLPPSGWTGVIGQLNQPFHSLYVSNIYEDGTKLSDKYATKNDVTVSKLIVWWTQQDYVKDIIYHLITNQLTGTFIVNDNGSAKNHVVFSKLMYNHASAPYEINIFNTSTRTWYQAEYYTTSSVPSNVSDIQFTTAEAIDPQLIEDLNNQVNILYKEVQNLKYAAEGSSFIYETDSNIAFEKTTPLQIGPYAALEKLGGQTYARDNLINKPDAVIVDGWNSQLTFRSDDVIRVKATAAGTESAYYSSNIRIPIKYFDRYKRYRFKCDSFAANSTNIPRIIIRALNSEGTSVANIYEVNKDSANPLTMDGTRFFPDMTGALQPNWDQIAYININLYASSGAVCPANSYADYKGLYIGEEGDTSLYHAEPVEEMITSIGTNLLEIPTEMRNDCGYSINCQNGRIYFSGSSKTTGNIVWNLNRTWPAGTYTVSLFNQLKTSGEKQVSFGLVTKSPTAPYQYVAAITDKNATQTFTVDYDITGFCLIVESTGIDLTQMEVYPMITKGSHVPTKFSIYTETLKSLPQELMARRAELLPDFGVGLDAENCNYIDFENKKYIRKCATFNCDGTNNTIALSSTNDTTGYYKFTISNAFPVAASNTINGKLKTNWVDIPPYSIWADYSGLTYEQIACQNSAIFVVINKSKAATAADFKTYLTNKPLSGVYVLKQYEEYDLSEYLVDDEFVPVEENGTLFFNNHTYKSNLFDSISVGQTYTYSGMTFTYNGNGNFTCKGTPTSTYTRWLPLTLPAGDYGFNMNTYGMNRQLRFAYTDSNGLVYKEPSREIIIPTDNTSAGIIISVNQSDVDAAQELNFNFDVILTEGRGRPPLLQTENLDIPSTITYQVKVGA